jgi:regulator of protease activity HflC (stomatin/prohibitin superfamily)
MVDGLLVWLVLGCVFIVLLIGVVVRIVPEHQQVVVTRFGRVVRVVGPGVVFRLPGLEQVTVVSVRPRERQIVVSATTRDGVRVQLLARVICRITEPSRSLTAPIDAFEATLDVLESRLHSRIMRSDIWSVLPPRADLGSELLPAANELTAMWGVEVLELDLLDIDARLSGTLLRELGIREHRQ